MEQKIHIINAQVVFGNPKINCDGYGICKIITKNNPLFPCCPSEQMVEAQIFIEFNLLHFIFQKKAMCSAIYQKYFGKGIFIMGTDFYLPQTITKVFDVTPSVLRQGKYKFFENKTQILLDCPLQQHVFGLKQQTFELAGS